MRDPPPLCSELKEKASGLRLGIARVGQATGSLYSVYREHKWDIFGENDPELGE